MFRFLAVVVLTSLVDVVNIVVGVDEGVGVEVGVDTVDGDFVVDLESSPTTSRIEVEDVRLSGGSGLGSMVQAATT